MPSQPEIFLLVQFQAKPGKEEEAKQATLEFQEQATQEPNCISVWFHQHPDDPIRFMLYELWTDKETFNGPQHQQSPGMQRFIERSKEFMVDSMEITQYQLIRQITGPAGR